MAPILKRIHVNRHNITANRKADDAAKPPFTVKTSRGNTTGWQVVIQGPSELVYRPEKPLSCGAVAWVETRALVLVDGRGVE